MTDPRPATSSTVENYLKIIYMAQGGSDRLVPMGEVASALSVAPGTATTMIKALAEAELVVYEPYVGVKLRLAGEQLAARVLRRHRLVELFLVRVMQMGWEEVHDEAERLEHAVSDRLIDRIDEMLGRPVTDPHGDPIPAADGTVRTQPSPSLLMCALGIPVTVVRVLAQDAAFLRFVEERHLMPGETITVEARDGASDSVRIRTAYDLVTMGERAASKLLVREASEDPQADR